MAFWIYVIVNWIALNYKFNGFQSGIATEAALADEPARLRQAGRLSEAKFRLAETLRHCQIGFRCCQQTLSYCRNALYKYQVGLQGYAMHFTVNMYQ
jgi:hypothetical protein